MGVGRAFSFGGAKDRLMEETICHFDDKLIGIEDWMKTASGKRMARERCERLRVFKEWWGDEMAILTDN